MARQTPKLTGIYGAGGLGRGLAALLPQNAVFVDDTPEKQGTVIDKKPVLSARRFLEQTRAAPDYALYVGIWHPGFSFAAKQKELSALGLRCMPFTRAVLDCNARHMFFEPRAQLQKKMPRYRKLAALLADDKSRRVLNGHLSLRQSGDFSDLVWDNNRVPGFLARRLGGDISFVDAGAYNGDTVGEFVGCRGAYRKIYALEPDPGNLTELKRKFPDNLGGKLRVMRVALAAKRGLRNFAAGNSQGSALSGKGKYKVKAVRWEDIPVRPPAYWKLDIEGEEPAVIRAAAARIAETRPLLSISVYHAPDDLLDIAEILLQIKPAFKLYLRCHDQEGADLMLYALPEKSAGRSA